MSFVAAEHERGLAGFIAQGRRERFAAALAKGGKARAKETARLHGGAELDDRWRAPAIDHGLPGDAFLAEVERRVLAVAPGAVEAYVVSGDPALDGFAMPLTEAIHAAVWATEGSLLSIVPGRVVLCTGELADSTVLLVRPASS